MTDPNSVKFIELIFDPDPRSTLRYKSAYRWLARNPHQLFTLLLQKDVSTEFFSAFALYGKRLATLLSDIPKFFGQESEHQLQLGKEEINVRLFEELLGVLLFSLLPLAPADTASQETLAEIAMAVIKVSRPGGLLELIGAELGEKPVILTRLIADGGIGFWSQEQPASFKSLTSNCWRNWGNVALHIVDLCTSHTRKFSWMDEVEDWETLKKLVESLPCNSCPKISSPSTDKPPPPRANPRTIINTSTRAFDSLLGQHLGLWKIVISALALKNFRKVAVDAGHLERIRARLHALARGKWVKNSLRGPTRSSTQHQVPVYKASCQENAILWQVDIAFDERHDTIMQVIKVWVICPNSEVKNMCEWIAHEQQNYSEARIAACKTEDLSKLKGAISPQVIMADPKNLRGKPPAASAGGMTESSPLLGKFYSLTSTVLTSIERQTSAEFPVDPSEEEIHIINHVKSPAFILGRSGTGKTTCLVYKLASRYLTTKIEDEAPVRQLLLTRSSNLAEKIKVYTQRLINARLGKAEEDRPSGTEDYNNSRNGSEEDTTQDLLSLKDSDFPLVCTFGYFLRLLENAIKLDNIMNRKQSRSIFTRNPPLVNDTTFRLEYWRRLPIALTRRAQVDMAYVDIMGVIKGSASLNTNLEPLSREDYTAKRWRNAPNFTWGNERNTVYSLYESYEKIKNVRGEIDHTDRVISIFKSLRESPRLQEGVESLLHEIYVDEVQDQRPLEIELLLSLIHDPRGIHFAGDTAQSISKDSLFRFATAKALFYTRFSDSSARGKNSGLSPELLPLSYNYRSHRGILSVASVIMELLYAGFRELVDKSPPEVGDQIGPKPTLYIGPRFVSALHGAQEEPSREDSTKVTSRKEDLEASSFGAEGSVEETSKKENVEASSFGGERVIIVRDEETQGPLQKKVKKSALVLTILQSKGMEFEDVFLYDFFSASPYGSDFKILEELLEKYISSDPNDTTHSVDISITMCSELKQLYVAVTRARARLWIIENETDVVRPIIKLFNNVVQKLLPRRYPEELLRVMRDCEFTNISQLQQQFASTKKSTPTRWKELGYQFIENKAYEQALFCFEKAEDRVGLTLAKAYLAEVSALECKATGLEDNFFSAYNKACDLFLEAGWILKAVECQKAMGKTEAAANIFAENDRHEEAAWLYFEAGEHEKDSELKRAAYRKAAREYCEVGNHVKVLAACYHGGLYKQLIDNLNGYSKINPNYRKQYARLCYLRVGERDLPELQMKIRPSLGSTGRQKSAFQEFGMLHRAFELYRTDCNIQDVCDIAVAIGFLDDALSLAENHATLQDSVLANVFNHVQARDILTDWSGPRRDWRQYAQILKNEVITSLQQQWESLAMVVHTYKQNGNLPDRNLVHEGVFRSYLDLLVIKITPESALSTNLTQLPLDFIERAITILDTTINEKYLPPEALLCLGIFPTPYKQYIALPWSLPGIEPKLGYSIQYMITNTLHVQGSQAISAIISSALAFIDEICRLPWESSTTNEVFREVEIGWSRDRFSANLQALVSLNRMFLNLDTALCYLERRDETVTQKWTFWKVALIRQMTFISSCEQDASVLIEIKNELLNTTPDLYFRLQELLLSEVESLWNTQSTPKFHLLSLVLRQWQETGFTDHGTEWNGVMHSIAKKTHSKNLKEVYEVVALARAVRNTAPGDFPVPFIERIHKLLYKLKKLLDSCQPRHLFYSASLLSFYEEFVTLLLLLILPLRFAIPRSWAALHLPKFQDVPRRRVQPEMTWYQWYLVQTISSLCELVIRIEESGFRKTTKNESLARRSINIIAVGVINVRTLNPLPSGSHNLWKLVPKVFSYSQPFANVSAAELPRRLIESFAFFEGKDDMKVAVTEGYRGPNTFAGLPVQQSSMINLKYQQVPYQHHTLKKRQIIAAYTYMFTLISTPIAEQMRRECEVLKTKHRASIQLKDQQLIYQCLKKLRLKESRACRNCCLITVEANYCRRFTY